jgi:hypothetical protein
MIISAILIPILLCFIALCVDLLMLTTARTQLQTMADAAALAGAVQFNDPRRVSPTFDPVQNDLGANARRQAIAIGQANLVLGRGAALLDNTTNAPGGDIVLGLKDVTVKGSPLVTDSTLAASFNTVQVTARRDAGHVGQVPLFFAPLMGIRNQDVQVTSMATAQLYQVKGVKGGPTSQRTGLIPIALSSVTWGAMLAGLTSDNYSYSKSNGGYVVQSGGDGISESSLYPVDSGSGNWGTVNIGTNNNSTSFLGDQIQYGVTQAQIAATPGSVDGNFVLNPDLNLSGNPGTSLGIKSAINSRIGQVVIVPIYDPVLSSGEGNGFNYVIVGFAPVAVLSATFNGKNSQVIVQPAIADPVTAQTVITGPPQTSWTSGGVVRLRLSQ